MKVTMNPKRVLVTPEGQPRRLPRGTIFSMQSSLYGGSWLLAGFLLLTMTAFPQAVETRPLTAMDELVRDLAPQDVFRQARDAADGEFVSYTDFLGNVHGFRQFNGVYVAVLMAPDDLERLTLSATRRFIDDADRLYAHYQELTGWEPSGDGRLEIAILDIPPAGWAKRGFRWTEIDSATLQDGLRQVAAHEMGHNFDTLGDFIFSGDDPAHAWTELWDLFVIYDLESLYFQAAHGFVGNVPRPRFVEHPNWNWERCVQFGDANCGIPNNSMYGVSVLVQGDFVRSIALLHDPAGIQKAMRYLSAAVRDRALDPASMSPFEKNALLLESLGNGIGVDLSCYTDEWNWPISQELRADLAASYGPNPNCADADGDGFRPIDGDLDDHNPAAYPGAEELPGNQVDENYNTAVDEVLVTEDGDFPPFGGDPIPIPVPSRVQGTIASLKDGDLFEIYLPAPTVLRVTSTVRPESSLDYVVSFYPNPLPISREGYADGRGYIDALGAHISLQTLTMEAGRYLVYVYPPLVESVPGPYDFTISMDTTLSQAMVAGYPETTIEGRHQLRAPNVPNELLGLPGVAARFWVEGSGWVGSAPVSSGSPVMVSQGGPATFDWTVPASFDRCSQGYRVQFYSGGVPVSAPSLETRFSTRGVPCLSTDGVVNAASFLTGAVAPGEIVTIFGAGIGPASVVGATVGAKDLIDTRLSDTRVLFDGIPTPLVYVYGAQVSAIVPYAVAKRSSTRMEVEYRGVRSDPVSLDVTDAAPALFTQNSSGQGSGAILNQDYSLNNGTQPARPGSVVLLFATGAGETTPAGTDGLIASEVLPQPRLGVKVELIVTSGGFRSVWPLQVLYAGAAPGLVAGVLQVNVRIPPNLPAGRHDVVLTVGGKMSPTGITLTVE